MPEQGGPETGQSNQREGKESMCIGQGTGAGCVVTKRAVKMTFCVSQNALRSQWDQYVRG